MRKSWKRLSALLLALVMVLSLVPVTALAARMTDDEVAIDAPEVVVDEAAPAGAVDVSATLFEGETTTITDEDGNIAYHKTIHAYNKNNVLEDEAETGNTAAKMVDGDDSESSRWASAANMKASGANGAKIDNPKTVILDLGWGKCATDVTKIVISWFRLVWAKNYTISTAATEDAAEWTTVYTAPGRDNSSDSGITDTITSLETTTLQRFVKFYFEDINLTAGGSGLSIQEIEIYGELKNAPVEGLRYTTANINAGLFDVAVTPTQNSNGSWTANYQNTLSGNSTDNTRTGSVITATAISYVNCPGWNDGPPWVAVDGRTGETADAAGYKQFYTAYTNVDSAPGGGSYVGEAASADNNNRYIELKIETGAEELSGLRYYPGKDNAATVLTYKVEYKEKESDTWSEITATPDSLSDALEWKLITFNNPVTAKYIRFWGLTTKKGTNTGDMSVGEIRLVKSGEPQELQETLSGKVVDGSGAAVSGATVTLAKGAAYTVQSVSTTTDGNGNYAFSATDLGGLDAGTYYVRASKDGHGTKINVADPVALDADKKVPGDGYNVKLPEIDTSNVAYLYDMANEEGHRPTLGRVNGDTFVGVAWTDDNKMTLQFKARQEGSDNGEELRMNRLVKLLGTNVMNGIIEFDATRAADPAHINAGRFGLALRLQDKDTWIFVGQWNQDDHWAREYWPGKGVENVYTSATDVNGETINFGNAGVAGPSFAPGDTRHFKVTVNGNALKLEIDGVTVFDAGNINNGAAAPTGAADVGFICGNGAGGGSNPDYGLPTTVTIDNLYITRNDPRAVITLTQPSSGTLSAKRFTSAGDLPLAGSAPNTLAFAGETIKVSATGLTENYVLDSLAITKKDDNNTPLTEEELTALNIKTGENNAYISFEMPNYAINVEGVILPVLTGVEIKGADGESAPVLKVGKSLSAVAKSGNSQATEGVVYAWYHQAQKEQDAAADATEAGWAQCTTTGEDGTATPIATDGRGIFTSDEGKKIKVVVTGDGKHYAKTVSVEAVTTDVMAEADVPLTSVGLTRTTITMVMNDTTAGTTGNTVGATTVLTANLTPSDVTLPATGGIVWSITEGSDVVSLAAVAGHPEQQTVTASKPGTAKVKVTVNAVEAPETAVKEAIVTINVTKKLESITVNSSVTKDENGRIVIYANDSGELTDGKANSVDLTAGLVPVDATDVTLSWTHPNDGDDGVVLTPHSDNNKIVTVRPKGVDDTSFDIDATLVGDHTVTVTQDGTGDGLPTASVTIRVKRLMATAIQIDGTLKNGETLTADITDLMMTDEVKGTLDYQWKRGDDEISGAKSETYKLTDADVGKIISVVVSAAENDEFYEGSVTATATEAVAKGDGPDAPTGLSGVAPTADGGKGSITGLENGKAYQYAAKGASDTAAPTEESAWNTLDATTQLDSGAYWVRLAATDYNEAGAAAQVTVPAFNDTRPTITKGTMTNGTVNVDERAAENDVVTITVVPNTGYKLSAGSLTVTKASGGTVDVSEGSTAGTWTFTMPGENVTVNATFELQTFTITHNLTDGLSCSKGTAASHTVNWNEATAVTIVADAGHDLPEKANITVVGADGTALADNAWSYNAATGAITITGGVRQNITITAAGVAKKYTVTPSLTNGLTSTGSTQATHNTEYTITLSVQSDSTSTRELPDAVTVKRGNTELTLGTDYTYDKTSGLVTVKAAAVTGNLTITAAGKVKTTPLTAVEIEIQHTDANTEEKTIPHVGDTLVAHPKVGDVTEGVTATYKWFVDGAEVTDVTDATGQSYVVREGDKDKTIKVEATGSNNYSGKQEATTQAVKVKVVKATGISLNPSTATVVVNESVTLTATLTPTDANANNTVTWTSSNAAVATVSTTGVVTGKKAGNAQITAALPDGKEATCTVRVTAPVTSVTIEGTKKVGETLTATVDPADATVNYTWVRVKDDTETTIGTNAKTYTLVAADKDSKIKVTVEGTGNYTGEASDTTQNAVVGADEEVPLDTAALEAAITAANTAKEGVETLDKEVGEVEAGTKFVTTAEMKALTDAIAAAQAVKAKEDATQAEVDEAKTALNTAVETFKAAVKEGTKPVVDTTDLDAAIAAANTAKTGVTTMPEGTEESTVSRGTKYVTEAQLTALTDAITAAENAKKAADKTDESVAAAAAALNTAVETFNAAVKTGTKQSSSSSRPSSSNSTSTVTNPDGSVTTTVTQPDGTKIVTTEKPDGTVESVKTQKDGTVLETVITPDGVKESVETKPDGTVTETVTDAEGAITEKVTDPDENVTITVTDPEGEELAKVEIPAEIPEPETTFEDAEEHWAKESINKIAALGLVNGTGDNKYGTEASMTRGALATVLYRLSNNKGGYRVSFNDVVIGQYYTEGVAWAAKAKVVTGYTSEIFAPNDTITREQLAVMLARYAKLIGMDTAADANALDQFADGDNTGAWAVDGMAWAVQNGILRGRNQNTLDPTAKVTRAEVAVMLDRFIELIK